MLDPAIDQAKQDAREKVWGRLHDATVALPPGAHGRIPNFVGADLAAARLATLDTWTSARVLKTNPDTAQHPVRVRALADGKLLYMAVPKLATPRPFYLLDPSAIIAPHETIATGDGARQHALSVGVEEMRPVDLIVAGSVAVNRQGVRVGKGAGYSYIEVALLTEAGLIGPDTVIVTTVHPLQILDQELPETEHDFSVDVIVTSTEVIQCSPRRRPRGIVRKHLTSEKISAIPALGPFAR
ncbi:5-formyltetrahydrofolate cyclo-ligase [Catellatospora methionotrophica]|uniref:5-formyltetrahydrofolate cyclo-ligase n=1 Tax=Catellatospora methionotrophica TaxID=121620 RepID=UPI0033E8C897